MSDSLWYCVQSKPQKEPVARDNLQNQNFLVLFPQIMDYQHYNTPKIRPLFPGYLFVAFDVYDPDWRRIPSTYGVRRLMCYDADHPISIPTRVMNELIITVGSDLIKDERPLVFKFQPGEKVRVRSGPFVNFVGLVQKTEKESVEVLFSIFGRESPAWMEKSQLVLTQ